MLDFPERREYPDYYDWQKDPVCPVCGEVCDTIYYSDFYGGIVGCSECITKKDPEEVSE